MHNVKISSKHQITIGKEAFDAAGFRAGDVVTVRALGPGRVEVTGIASVLERYAGAFTGAEEARSVLEELRAEWD